LHPSYIGLIIAKLIIQVKYEIKYDLYKIAQIKNLKPKFV